jgi:hypothetical protein
MDYVNASLSYDPNRLLDRLYDWTGIADDLDLARLLHVSPQVIHAIRKGQLPIRVSILVPMAECVGKSMDELRAVLGDRRRKARMPSIVRTARG